MSTVSKKYIPAHGPDTNCLVVEVYYDLGGYSYLNYCPKPRGYYVSVVPMMREQKSGYCTESVILGHGARQLLVEVQRKSQKAAAKAEEESEQWIPSMIDWVCQEYGITVDKSEEDEER